jgi:CP family cyanate transporter-like MFS transporter
VGANLRIGVVSIGPVLEDIRSTLGMSRPVAGLLTMIPLLALAVFSFLGGRWTARLGPRLVLLLALSLLVASLLGRAWAPTVALLLLATVPIGVAVAVAGAALPVLIKLRFTGAAGAATGAYVTALDAGAGICALTAVPLAGALGGWRTVLALTAVPAVAALPLVAALTERWLPLSAPTEPLALRRRGRVRTIAVLAGLFAAQSFCFVGVITWISAVYRASGWSPGAAGMAAGVVLLGALPTALAVPLLSDRIDRRCLVLPAAAATAAGVAGMAGWPTLAPVLWLALFAAGSGALFPLALTMPLDVTSDAGEAGRLAGLAVGIGYGLSAFAPVAVGALHDATGGFTVPFALLAVSGALAAPFALLSPRAARETEARSVSKSCPDT